MSQRLAGIPSDVVEQFHLDRLPFDQVEKRPDQLMSLAGRRAVVTGGGGGDLGQAIVHRLAAMGAHVAAVDIDEPAAKEVAEDASGRWGADVFAMRVDVTDWDDVHRTFAEAGERMGGLDLLVNNAGGALRLHGSFLDQQPDAMRRVIDLNFVGLLYATRAALAQMLPSDRGRIVNIASEGGKISLDGITVYNACKSAVIGFTRNLARELRETRISSVAVCPGVMVGPHALERLGSDDVNARRAALEQSYERLTAGRFSLPEEVANVVAFLASDAGAYVHGTAVSVGGGLSD
ncbi:MAG: Diacetyl reductase [Pseudonocardiales bacterium]|nr:Diacetyl reductase [Pseudonocardiales bacterium]